MQRIDLPAVGLMRRGAPEQMMQQMRGEPIGHEQVQNAAVIKRVAIDRSVLHVARRAQEGMIGDQSQPLLACRGSPARPRNLPEIGL